MIHKTGIIYASGDEIRDNNISLSAIRNRACSSFVYDSCEYTLVCPYSESGWGVGLVISDTSIKWKSGEIWLVSMDVYTPQEITWNCDINNKPDLDDYSSYTGNDYDQAPRYTYTNGVANKNLSVGWNKIWFTQKAPTTYGLFNWSTNFGIVTSSIGSENSITVKLKNIKGEIVPDGESLVPTPWTMNENDWGFVGNDHGFIERFNGEHPMSVYEGHYEMDEIIEY